MCGPEINAAIVAEVKSSRPELRVELIGILAARRAPIAPTASCRTSATPTPKCAQRPSPRRAGGRPRSDRRDASRRLERRAGRGTRGRRRAVALVAGRNENIDKRAEPLLGALDKLSDENRTALLPTLGRIGGPAALQVVEEALADPSPQVRKVGLQALCNWPNASVAKRLLELAQNLDDENSRNEALWALIRVAPLPDSAPTPSNSICSSAMALTTGDDQRNYIVKRCRAIRTIESLRFAAPYMEKPEFAREACATVVELAHHRELREPNKAEFDKALDAVIRISKDPDLIDRATPLQKGET